ncbi:hypothetical protein M2454_000467 [Aequitasia blattaphilus]|uniref:Pentapeptide repeat-containing protein n=1 Tax=Aequitasia blattaphilus TaxID=2949332 RepID=A0ABT1E5M6_9FIRM|nr:pentapeptide repeat-containing protein [Aequitasia blattaphilus]MCP1101143.1 pentapeptide repeat-containing protein [Aequitasia blattaphilus]MCR8613783.1 pentapeptide repeat-containing protein [Aequitasia blattaphilus]
MRNISREELLALLQKDQSLEGLGIEDMDLTGTDFSGKNLRVSVFRNVNLSHAKFCSSCLDNALFLDANLVDVDFSGASMHGTALRSNDLTGANLRGADLFSAVLEGAILDNVKHDQTTKWFDMYCPKEGAFLGYKKCVNDRIVQLLIPADAKRSSATLPSCRCNKAKVLTIKSADSSKSFTEAWSLVDESFVYRVGEWIEVKDFNDDRFMDSTRGIHFWMTREEAIAY